MVAKWLVNDVPLATSSLCTDFMPLRDPRCRSWSSVKMKTMLGRLASQLGVAACAPAAKRQTVESTAFIRILVVATQNECLEMNAMIFWLLEAFNIPWPRRS